MSLLMGSDPNTSGLRVVGGSMRAPRFRATLPSAAVAALGVLLGAPAAWGAISISGTCNAYNQSTNCANAEVVKVAVNGTLQAQTTTTLTGAFTIAAVTVASGDVVTVFVDNVADANEAVAVTKYDGSGNITGVLLYEEHLTVGSADNQNLTNTNLGNYDNSVSGDEDVFFEHNTSSFTCDGVASTTGLCVDGTGQSTQERLYIKTGNTLSPGGNVQTAKVQVVGTYTAGSETLTLTGSGTGTSKPFLVSGTFTPSTGTVVYNSTSATEIRANTTIPDYYNLSLIPAGTVTYTLTDSGFVEGALTIGDGSHALTMDTTNVNAQWFFVGSTSSFTVAASAVLSEASASTTFRFSGPSGGTRTITANGQNLGIVDTVTTWPGNPKPTGISPKAVTAAGLSPARTNMSSVWWISLILCSWNHNNQ